MKPAHNPAVYEQTKHKRGHKNINTRSERPKCVYSNCSQSLFFPPLLIQYFVPNFPPLPFYINYVISITPSPSFTWFFIHALYLFIPFYSLILPPNFHLSSFKLSSWLPFPVSSSISPSLFLHISPPLCMSDRSYLCFLSCSFHVFSSNLAQGTVSAYFRRRFRCNFAHLLHFSPSNAELNPICHLLTLFGAHHIFHVSG